MAIFTGPATPVSIIGPGSNGASIGFQSITGLSSAQSLTVPTGAVYAVVSPSTQAVRWRSDGTAPTATVGMPLAVNADYTFSGADLAAVKFIEQTASASLNVTYY